MSAAQQPVPRVSDAPHGTYASFQRGCRCLQCSQRHHGHGGRPVTRWCLCPVAEACPACDQIEGVELTTATARVEAWRCTRCGMSWAVTVVNPPPALSVLRAVITLADETPELADAELRDRLLALAESCGAR